MDKQKINTLIFFALWMAAASILISQAVKLMGLIQNEQVEVTLPYFLQIQKKITLNNILFFVPLLISALIGYYLNHRKNLLFLSNLLYIAITLVVYVNANKSFHESNQQIATDQKGYWLFLFIGIFYILGAILISAISFITVRNLLNREDNSIKKGKQKINLKH